MSVHPGSVLNARRRRTDLDRLTSGTVDVLVVGGGVTGCGVALDAASRGLSVALVEREDLAFGTSRWSSKLVHGGLRYLAQGDVALARQSARERAVLMSRTAPHLVRSLPMVVPFRTDWSAKDRAGLTAAHYASHLLGFRTGLQLSRPRPLDLDQMRALLPGLKAAGTTGGHVNYDGQLEDDARLVIGLARTAAVHGARILTRTAAVSLDAGGADLLADGARLRIDARTVINATGVWAGTLDPDVRLRPSKGTHLVLPAAALGHPTGSMTVAVPGEHNRWVFALPHPDGLVYVGLTDDPVEGPMPDEPEATEAEADFLLTTISTALERPLTRADVVGSYAGLRPLLAGVDGCTADLSRRHAVRQGSSGVWSVLGGKLTTYRQMAQDAVDAVLPQLTAVGRTAGPCRTTDLPLVGADSPGLLPAGVPPRLVRRYGSEAADVAALAGGDASLLRPVAEGVPVLGVELVFGALVEGAATVDDLLARRTRLSLVPAWAAAGEAAAECALAAAVEADAVRPGATLERPRQEVLDQARPLPPLEQSIIDELTEGEAGRFMEAILDT